MAEAKTRPTKQSVASFIKGVDEERRKDCSTLVRIMKDAVGAPATMWGTSIVGFGTYELKYADGRTADWPIIGFSPRKQDLTLYVGRGVDGTLLKALGKHKLSGGCLYIKRLSDVDLAVLEKVVSASVKDTRRRHR
ncbi:MAG TPA: DUF1801 domain-containing protein [Vicinamibacterales bacterium]|nr:DUF1801 domain-containing protein [Vicinamibacterales bacterium]